MDDRRNSEYRRSGFVFVVMDRTTERRRSTVLGEIHRLQREKKKDPSARPMMRTQKKTEGGGECE